MLVGLEGDRIRNFYNQINKMVARVTSSWLKTIIAYVAVEAAALITQSSS